MSQKFNLTVNGKTHTVDADPDMPLLYALRDELGLNNPHFGCGLAQCGACTVHLDGQAIRSCVTPLSVGRQRQDHDARRARHARAAASAADRLCRGAGAAMRLLHQRLAHDRRRLPGEEEKAERSRDQGRALRPQVPLRHAHQHSQGGQARRRDDGLRESVMTKFEKTSSFTRRSVLLGGGALVVSVGAAVSLDTVLSIGEAYAQGAKPPLTPDQLSSYIAVNADGSVAAYFGKMDMGHGLACRHRPDRRRRTRRAVQERQGHHGRHRHLGEPGRRFGLDRHPARRQADAHGRGGSAPRAGRDGGGQASVPRPTSSSSTTAWSAPARRQPSACPMPS